MLFGKWFMYIFTGLCLAILSWPTLMEARVRTVGLPRLVLMILLGAVLVLRTVALEKARAQEIEYLSCHDQLTGLHNRVFLKRALRKLDTAQNLPPSIVMADLDGPKTN